jgi:hypothetical protein
MRIREGNFDAVPLNGISWAISYHFPAALHLGNGTVQPFIEEKATPDQRNAILTILSGKVGCPWFEVIASVVSKVLEPKFVPIKFEFDLKKRMGKTSVPGEIEVTTEPIRDMNGKELRVEIHIPEGMEYFEAEVAVATTLKSKGEIPFDYCDTHSTFSEVEYTPTGLKR